MTERRHPTTGPVTLPENPRKVAASKVGALADLGMLHKPPTEREYEHAALDIALDGSPEEHVFAVLAHLDDEHLHSLATSLVWLTSGVENLLRERGHEDPAWPKA